MPGGTDWTTLAPAVIAAVGFGTIAGSAITTYGGRGQERRKVRSRALKCLEHLEVMREQMKLEGPDPEQDKPLTGLAEFRHLRVSGMLAGVPRSAIDIYGKIGDDAPWLSTADDSDPRLSHLLSSMLGDAAAQLIQDALYRPRLTQITYRRRVKKLRGMAWKLYGPGPDMTQWGTPLPVLYRRWCRIRAADEKAWKEKYGKVLEEFDEKTAAGVNLTELAQVVAETVFSPAHERPADDSDRSG
jgi:hypothetical protein